MHQKSKVWPILCQYYGNIFILLCLIWMPTYFPVKWITKWIFLIFFKGTKFPVMSNWLRRCLVKLWVVIVSFQHNWHKDVFWCLKVYLNFSSLIILAAIVDLPIWRKPLITTIFWRGSTLCDGRVKLTYRFNQNKPSGA